MKRSIVLTIVESEGRLVGTLRVMEQTEEGEHEPLDTYPVTLGELDHKRALSDFEYAESLIIDLSAQLHLRHIAEAARERLGRRRQASIKRHDTPAKQ
jgi:hypothetical protein